MFDLCNVCVYLRIKIKGINSIINTKDRFYSTDKEIKFNKKLKFNKMKKSLTIILTLSLMFSLVNCKAKKNSKSDKIASNESSSLVIVNPEFIAPEENDAFEITNAEIKGNDLILNVTYSGGCQEHEFKAYSNNMYMKSMPPILGLFIAHNSNGDNCRTLVEKTLRFDLSSVKYPGTDSDYTLMLRINNWKGDLEYKY